MINLHNPTFKGVDARLHLNDSINARWKKITDQKKYLKASEVLYDVLYHR